MKKYNMLRGIYKLIGATFLMCFIGLFLCKTEAYATCSFEENEDGTGFYIVKDEEDTFKSVELRVNDCLPAYKTLLFTEKTVDGEKIMRTQDVLYANVLKENGANNKFGFEDGKSINFAAVVDGTFQDDFDSPIVVYDLSKHISLDGEETTAIGNLYKNDGDIEITATCSGKRFYLEGDKISEGSTVAMNFGGTLFKNKVLNKYYVGVDSNPRSKWDLLQDTYSIKLKEDYYVGDSDDINLYFYPRVNLEVVPDKTISNLKYTDIVNLKTKVFMNTDEEGYGDYEGYSGYQDAKMEWKCTADGKITTVCNLVDEDEEETSTTNLVGNEFEVAVKEGNEGTATWTFSINIGDYPTVQDSQIATSVPLTFVYQKSGLVLYNNGQVIASGGNVYATEGEKVTTLSLKTTNGKSLSDCYSSISLSPSGTVEVSSGKITIPAVTSSGTYTITARNSETGEDETIDFNILVSGKPSRVELLDGSDEITSGLTLRLNDSNLVFYDKNDNILKGVALKTAIVADEDILEVKKDNSGIYLVADEPGTTEVQLVLADGTELEEILEITVYPMPTLTYESNRSLKVGMPYKVAIPGSKDSLKQVTGFKLYVYHDDDKLGEFDMSDMGLSSFSSSAKDSTGTRTLTVSAGAVEKIITNLANNGRFSGDSMGITFKAVPIGKRKAGGSTTYETNKDKVFGEDSTTVYRVGISVAGCTVTQSSRYGLSGQEISFTSDQSNTNWTGVGTGGSSTTGSTAKYTVGTNTTTNLALKATANGSSNGSTSPVQPGTNSGGANGTGAGADGLDDVPKTSESNAPMWLIVIVVLAAIGGAYALYLQLRPVTEMGYYEEDEDDRPNF